MSAKEEKRINELLRQRIALEGEYGNVSDKRTKQAIAIKQKLEKLETKILESQNKQSEASKDLEKSISKIATSEVKLSLSKKMSSNIEKSQKNI
jgi:hypothetical protein